MPYQSQSHVKVMHLNIVLADQVIVGVTGSYFSKKVREFYFQLLQLVYQTYLSIILNDRHINFVLFDE